MMVMSVRIKSVYLPCRKIQCNLVSESYVIEDCIATTLTETTVTGTSSGSNPHSINLDTITNLGNFELLFDFKTTGKGGVLNIGAKSQWSTSPVKANYRVSLGVDDSTLKLYCASRTTSTSGSTGSTYTENQYYAMKISHNGNTTKFYVDGVELASKTVSFWSNYSEFSIYALNWSTNNIIFKNLKLKPL